MLNFSSEITGNNNSVVRDNKQSFAEAQKITQS